MHISEGVLSGPVLVTGAGFAAAGIAAGLRSTREKDIPKVALLSAGFFVASLIHLPVGVTSVHLLLNGINGLILGWAAFPSIFIALVLQAVLFQFGGLTTLGVNTVIMAAPAVICRYLFFGLIRRGTAAATVAAFLCGALSVLMSALLLAVALMTTNTAFTTTAKAAIAAHLPVAVTEGLVTAVICSFLLKVKPEIFGGTK